MIEVEKKFQPTEEQLRTLLADAEFVGEKVLEDTYYDYTDYRLFKQEVKLRNRNGNFELKIGDDEAEGISVSKEIEDEEKIKQYFKTDKPLSQFIREGIIEIIHYKQKRRKYKKEEFAIDVDELDFGYKCVEIELLVGDESEIENAEKKIIGLAANYGFEIKPITPKRKAYFKLFKPDVYKKLYE